MRGHRPRWAALATAVLCAACSGSAVDVADRAAWTDPEIGDSSSDLASREDSASSDHAGDVSNTSATGSPATTRATNETTSQDGISAEPSDADDHASDRHQTTEDGHVIEHQDPATLDDAELAAAGFTWALPLVITRRTMQNFGGLIGQNRLFWGNRLAGPASRTVVAPNRDTIYSIAVLHLADSPMVFELPTVDDRYIVHQFLDAYTESFAYVGTRATGGRAGTWLITGPDFDGDVPDDMDHIAAPTDQVFILGRVEVTDEGDLQRVREIASASTLEPLSVRLAGTSADPPDLGAAPGPAVLAGANGIEFWDEVADGLADNPPVTSAGAAIAAELERRFGIAAGRRPSDEVTDPGQRAALEGAAATSAEDLATSANPRLINGWNARDDIGSYGEDFSLRASIARFGWGANTVDEALYPVARRDADGDPFDGSAVYRIRFEEPPTTSAFWSLSVYEPSMFFAEHPSGRYTLGDRDELVFGEDGSLELTLSHTLPDGVPEQNWLPTPPAGFVPMLRLYLPTGAWASDALPLPPVERISG